MRTFPILSSSICFAAAACGASHGTGPEDMTAVEHRDEATRHDREGMRAPYVRGSYLGGYHGDTSWGHPRGGSYWSHGYYPWAYSWSSTWDAGESHFAQAEQHQTAAGVLEKRYRDTCALVAPNTAARSPFVGFVQSVAPTERGIVLRLSRDAGPPDVLLAEIQCHTAWLQLEPRPEANSDITAVKGVDYSIRATVEGLDVSITSSEPAAVAEVRRRAEALRPAAAARKVAPR